MSIAIFVTAEAPGATVSEPDLAAVGWLLRELPRVQEALLYSPVAAPDQPFAADGAGPALTLELRFDTLAEAEAALAPENLGRLALASLPAARLRHQVFAVRDFPVDDPAFREEEPCTFLVRYSGKTPDPTAWHDHYDANHPPIMRRFPGIRHVATYRPIAWTGTPGWERDAALQRNKVVFDSPDALAAALASPVMAEMRADRATFPPFEGGATHHPMRTTIVV